MIFKLNNKYFAWIFNGISVTLSELREISELTYLTEDKQDLWVYDLKEIIEYYVIISVSTNIY